MENPTVGFGGLILIAVISSTVIIWMAHIWSKYQRNKSLQDLIKRLDGLKHDLRILKSELLISNGENLEELALRNASLTARIEECEEELNQYL